MLCTVAAISGTETQASQRFVWIEQLSQSAKASRDRARFQKTEGISSPKAKARALECSHSCGPDRIHTERGRRMRRGGLLQYSRRGKKRTRPDLHVRSRPTSLCLNFCSPLMLMKTSSKGPTMPSCVSATQTLARMTSLLNSPRSSMKYMRYVA